jgi:hypothetical protein
MSCCAVLCRAVLPYSFGIVMYELLTFKVPFEELRKEQVGGLMAWPWVKR